MVSGYAGGMNESVNTAEGNSKLFFTPAGMAVVVHNLAVSIH